MWWVSGGWALEAFTGATREHEDTDASVLRTDLAQLRGHLDGQAEVWTATSGTLRPPPPDVAPDLPPDEVLPPGCRQIWTRVSPAHPWEFDILLVPGSEEEWVYARDASLRMPMGEALWARDGITYLQPEIQLLYKAKGLRDKDQADFKATLPHLDARRRGWLRDALEQTLPGHPWTNDL